MDMATVERTMAGASPLVNWQVRETDDGYAIAYEVTINGQPLAGTFGVYADHLEGAESQGILDRFLTEVEPFNALCKTVGEIPPRESDNAIEAGLLKGGALTQWDIAHEPDGRVRVDGSMQVAGRAIGPVTTIFEPQLLTERILMRAAELVTHRLLLCILKPT